MVPAQKSTTVIAAAEDGSMIAAGSSCGWIAAAQLPLFQPNVIQKGPEARCLLKPYGLLLSLSVLGEASCGQDRST